MSAPDDPVRPPPRGTPRPDDDELSLDDLDTPIEKTAAYVARAAKEGALPPAAARSAPPAAPASAPVGGTAQYRPQPQAPAPAGAPGGTVQYRPQPQAPAPASAPAGTVQYRPQPQAPAPASAPGGTVQWAPPPPTAAPPRGATVREEGAPPVGEATAALFPDASGPRHAAPASAHEPGERVRQYELIRRLGKGGMGEVFLARDTKLGRRVAIKFLHTQDPDLVQRFVLEARATARCSHENIVTLYEADTHQGQPYMALEYLQGRTLAALLDDGKPMPPSRAVDLMLPVLRALDRAHAEGIVHRDLKPENVFLTDAGVVKVLDFGIAKVTGVRDGGGARRGTDPAIGAGLPSLTQHGTTLGTLAYMSPEQWAGGDLDRRTDLWAAGIMLFHMLAGKHPLHGLEGMQLARVARLDEPMPSLGAFAAGVPQRLVAAVDACLQKDRERRPPDAVSLLRALEPFLPGRIAHELEVDQSPYAGLSAFQEADADRFFGRDAEIAALVARLRDRPVMAVVGPSGIGKSSFVRAGVVPALKRSGEDWKAYVIRPGRNPLAALAACVAQVGATGSGSQGSVSQEATEEQGLVGRLVAEPGHAGSVLRAAARRHNRRLLLLVDQFEEMFTHAEEKERLAFTACLAGVADDATSPVRLVISIRSDFLERVAEDPRFMAELSSGLFFLTRPSDQGLRDALTRPAEMAGYRFESPEMVEEMVHDLRSTNGALSLLQFAASQLWEARDPARRVLTRASYESIGGITGALAGYADRFLEQLAEGPRAVARDLFLRLVTPDRTRAIVSLEDLREVSRRREELDALLEQLVQARLVVVSKSDRGGTAEIVHESLIHGWPTLRRWLDETGEDAHFLEQLRGGAKAWAERGRAPDLLWRGELADEARRFQRRYRGELPDAQKEFLGAVIAWAARAARRRRTFTLAGVAALLLVAAASLVATVIISRARQEAVQQRTEAVRQQAEAERQAGLARVAEAAARQRAEELAVKERERDAAAKAAEAASAELQVRNAELAGALSNAQDARRRATDARRRAEEAAVAARMARERADRAASELAARLAEEKARADRLQQQFGSPMAEVLPP